jgi:hypothetical protein
MRIIWPVMIKYTSPILKLDVFAMHVWTSSCRPVQALIARLCKDAAAAAADQQQQQVPPNTPRPPPGLGAGRGDVLLLARLLDILHTANVQVRCLWGSTP